MAIRKSIVAPQQTPQPPLAQPIPRSECLTGVRSWTLIRAYPDGYLLQSLNGGSFARSQATLASAYYYTTSTSIGANTYTIQPTYAQSSPAPYWFPRKRMEAKCFNEHDAPVLDCQCGLYVCRSPLPVSIVVPESLNTLPVLGEVNLWGRVIEHSDGWRGQYAYPKRLTIFDSPNSQKIAKALEKSYGVPVEVWE